MTQQGFNPFEAMDRDATAVAQPPIVEPITPVEPSEKTTPETPPEVVAKTQEPIITEPATKEKNETKEKTTPVSIDDLIREKSGGRFSKWEDVEQSLTKDPFADLPEYERKFLEYRKNGGGDVARWDQIQKLDTAKISSRDALVSKMLFEKPHLTEKQAQLLVNKQFPIPPEDLEHLDEAERNIIEIAGIELDEAGRDAKKFLEDLKVKEQMPIGVAEAKKAEEQKRQVQEWLRQTVSEQMKNLTDIKYKVNGKDLEFKISETDKEVMDGLRKVSELATNPEQLFNMLVPYWYEGKDFSPKKMVDFFAKAMLFDQFAKHSYDSGLAAGEESVISEVQNPDRKGKPSGGGKRTPEEVASAFFNS